MPLLPLLLLTANEKTLIRRHSLTAPQLFVDDVRATLREHRLADAFDAHYAKFRKKFGDALTVGHVVVCSDRACKAAGIPPIRAF